MKRVLMLVTVISVVAAEWAAAEAPSSGRRGEVDGPRLLAEALRSGTADAGTISAIVRWVLEEKEEKVAPGLVEALKAVAPTASSPTAGSPEAERWNAAARGAIAVFEGLLEDAQAHRRRDGRSALRDLAPVIGAAAPAVADALREADPAASESLLVALRVFAPAAKDLLPPLAQALRHDQPAVRLGAATALGALGPAAREAIPDLRSALRDPDAAVREAAAQALKRIQGE